jgi:hypothetical protein
VDLLEEGCLSDSRDKVDSATGFGVLQEVFEKYFVSV